LFRVALAEANTKIAQLLFPFIYPPYGYGLMSVACTSDDNVEIVDKMLKNLQTNINQMDFIEALRSNHLKIVHILLDHCLLRAAEYNLIFGYAHYFKKWEIVERMLNDVRFNITSPPMVANVVYFMGNPITKLFIKSPRFDPSDNFIYQYACRYNNIEIVGAVLEDSRVDPSVNENGALCDALINGYKEIVRLIMQHPQFVPCTRAVECAKYHASKAIAKKLLLHPRYLKIA
jgi:hypothetical protein